MPKGATEPITIYESRPPEWLPKAHASADLGYIGYFPPRDDEDEEVLTETKVKNGLVLAPPVLAETLSLQDNVRHCIVYEDALSELEDLMNQIFMRRAENVPPIPSSTFRLPSRVTLNDARRQAWFADLANPDVPLSKLGKNVPHGAKGHDLLDLLHTNNVATPRAVWFLRVFGGNESTGLRNKPMYNPTQYSVDWANVVTSYMKKQLAEITLPSAPRLSFNIKHTFKGVLGDPEKREHWISRFTYCLSLLRTFYAEGLVDNRTFLIWLAQQMKSCNLAQLGFIAKIADEYLEGMLVSRALTRVFVDACLQKLSEIRSATTAKEYLGNVEATLCSLISRSFLALPDAFVCPRAWALHSTLLEEVLSDSFNIGSLDSASEQRVQALRQTFAEQFIDVKRRNEAMLFRHLPPRVLGSLSSALSDIKLLNSLSGKTDMCSVAFFEDDTENYPSFARKLDLLLTWSVTSLQYGDHRPYAAACLLQLWRNKAGERAIRHDASSPDELIQDHLFDWLDTSEVAGDPNNLSAVSLLFGQLVKHQLYSYQDYIQRLIARGERGLSFDQEDCSRHRDFLRWIPLHSSCPSLVNQRKMTLYGIRAREIPEDLHEKEIRREIRQLLPELFGGAPDTGSSFTTTFWPSCGTLLSSPRFEQVKTMKQWLLPVLKKCVSKQEHGDGNDILKLFTMTTILMARTRCYGSILEIALFTLEHASSNELLTAVMETLRQHMEVWACMNVMQIIAVALYASHQFWRTRGIHTRALLSLLVEVDNGRYLDLGAREHVLADITAYTNALSPISQPSAGTVPPILPEILVLATDPAPEAPSNLAKSLWYKYMTSPDWAWKVWDNTVASLRLIPGMTADLPERRNCALRYAIFLAHVDQHLPNGFDDQVLQWFLGAGKGEVVALSADVWEVVTVVLLYLSIRGALTTTTILQGLIYPVWQMGAAAGSIEQGQSLEVLLAAANILFEHLLLKDECGTGVPPLDIFEAQGLQTRRRDVFREPHFSSLVDNLPMLVLVEQNPCISGPLRHASLSLRQAICHVSVFRQGVYRDLDIVRLAFEKLLQSRTLPEEMHEPLVNALRMMLRDPMQGNHSDSAGFEAVSSMLSPWKLAATAIEMRLTLKQLGEELIRDNTREATIASLDKIADFVFHHCTNTELVDFVAEMMTDVNEEVASKFLNAGFQCISEKLHAIPSLKEEDMARFVSDVGEVLRLLSRIVQPFQDEISQPHLTPIVQDNFSVALKIKFENIKDVIAAENGNLSEEVDSSQATHFAIFLARLLQFDLCFAGAWTPQTKKVNEELCSTLYCLILLHSAGPTLDLLAFPLLLDTLYYVIDEVPPDPKAVLAIDPYRNYPEFDLADLPSDMPPEYRSKLRALVPYMSQNLAIAGLAYATRDASGSAVHNQPVQNRPWEWTEYLGDAPVADPKGDDRPERQQVKNSASLSLELFATRMTGDAVVHSQAIGDPIVEGNIRTFQDDFSGESVFMRDWRETRVVVEDVVSSTSRSRQQDGDATGMPTYSVSGQGPSERRPPSRRASPASSVRTRASMHHHSGPSSVSSLRQSPVPHFPSRLSTSTISEPIDVDALELPTSSAQAAKRKPSADDDDDEIEIVEGPVVASRSKKPRAKAAPKTRAKKR